MFFCGTFAGFLTTVLVLEITMRRTAAPVYIQMRHLELVAFDDLATVMLAPALLTTTILLVTTAATRNVHFWLRAVATTLLAAVLVTSVLVNLPINAEQLNWTGDAPPADWAQVRDRWQLAHAFRTVAAVTAFAMLILAATGRSRTTAQPLSHRQSGVTAATPSKGSHPGLPS